MNVSFRNPESSLATFTAILSGFSLEKQDKHDGDQLKESVLPYRTLNIVTTPETGSAVPQKTMRKNLYSSERERSRALLSYSYTCC